MSSLVCPKCGTLSVGRSKDEDGLLARIAELEAALNSKVEQAETFHTEWRQAEAELAGKTERVTRLNLELDLAQLERDEARAALAERDRMLEKEYESSTPRMAGYMRWHEDLRARAEEGVTVNFPTQYDADVPPMDCSDEAQQSMARARAEEGSGT